MLQLLSKFLTESLLVSSRNGSPWKPELVGLHIVSDALIALAYYFMAFTLIYLLSSRQKSPFNWIFLLFSAFVIVGGTIHIMEIWTIIHPNYWLSGLIKTVAALIGLYTARELVALIPIALATPSKAQFEALKTEVREEKIAHDKLRETTFLYQQILDAISDLILCKGPQSRIIYGNKAFRDYYGMTLEQLQGIIDAPRVNPDYTQQYVKDDAYVFNTGQTLLIEEPVVRYDEQERWFSTVKSAIKDANGQITGTVGLSRDITEQKLVQAQLIQTEKMSSLGQMIAGVAHEINNPVSFIYGNIHQASEYTTDMLQLLQLYAKHYPQPVAEITKHLKRLELDFITSDFPKLLASMKEGADRITQIVKSLGNFSRTDEHKCQEVDIHEGINNTLLILRHRLKPDGKRPEIQVIKEYGQLPLVECYSAQLNQVFMNLLSNAIEAICERNGDWRQTTEEVSQSPRPTISIVTQTVERNRVVIRIADNGSGISTANLPRIFDLFFTTKPPGKGTGLGLAISYQIVVDKHGGQLVCHSTPGQGTEFVIELPTAQTTSKRDTSIGYELDLR